jgi:recombinational DNA repair protein (RecF pathway)
MHFTKTMAQKTANKATSYTFPLLNTFFEVELVEELGWLFALNECIGSVCKVNIQTKL